MPTRKELVEACKARSLSVNGNMQQLQRRLDKSHAGKITKAKPNAWLEYQNKMRQHVLDTGITEPSAVMRELARLYKEEKEKSVKVFSNPLPEGYMTVTTKFTKRERNMNNILFLAEGKNEQGEKQFLYCEE